jgi:hypothetical protein
VLIPNPALQTTQLMVEVCPPLREYHAYPAGLVGDLGQIRGSDESSQAPERSLAGADHARGAGSDEPDSMFSRMGDNLKRVVQGDPLNPHEHSLYAGLEGLDNRALGIRTRHYGNGGIDMPHRFQRFFDRVENRNPPHGLPSPPGSHAGHHFGSHFDHSSGHSLAETTGDSLYQHPCILINQYRHKCLQRLKTTLSQSREMSILTHPGPERSQWYSQLMHSLSSLLISEGSVTASTGLFPSILRIFLPYSRQALTHANPQLGEALFSLVGMHLS